MQKYRPFLIIAIALVVAVIGGILFFRSSRNQDAFTARPAGPSSSPTASNAARPLPADAVVTLEEFGDYQCPPCGALHPTLKKLKEELGTHLNFVFRNLPLTAIHKNALVAAQAAEAARVQSRFWEMHDFLYENQDLWKDDVNPKTIFLKVAADLGLDTARFARDMDDKQVQLRIAADEDAARDLGINGTPTILIEGRELRPEVTNPDGVRKGIELMLARKASPGS
ncbi:MAG TPA: thioredoxin domain-containing protein [Pyrinomonadaceae bacterium]|nr:thioredoxin domain-containing protein [Pyrinomonadaceae bacterium]